nr:hypothetical protein Iba_chr12fCG9640 [Ipomoea batatas]
MGGMLSSEARAMNPAAIVLLCFLEWTKTEVFQSFRIPRLLLRPKLLRLMKLQWNVEATKITLLTPPNDIIESDMQQVGVPKQVDRSVRATSWGKPCIEDDSGVV